MFLFGIVLKSFEPFSSSSHKFVLPYSDKKCIRTEVKS